MWQSLTETIYPDKSNWVIIKEQSHFHIVEANEKGEYISVRNKKHIVGDVVGNLNDLKGTLNNILPQGDTDWYKDNRNEVIGELLLQVICEHNGLDFSEQLMYFQDAIRDYDEEEFTEAELIDGIIHDLNNYHAYVASSKLDPCMNSINILIITENGLDVIVSFNRLFDLLCLCTLPKAIHYLGVYA